MTLSAIEQLRNGTFPREWTYNIVENKAAFTGKTTDPAKFNGDCNKGLTPDQVFEKWSQESRLKDRKTKNWRTVDKNGLGVLTGPAGGHLVAVDIDGADAEQVFADFMGNDYPAVDNPGTMSWRGKPTNRQLLYRMPVGFRQFFEKLGREQLDDALKKGGNSEVCIRYGGSYSVLPGSYHPDTKKQYEWLSYNDGQVADLPNRLVNWLMSNFADQSETFVPAALMESLEQGLDKAPISGKNVKQLARDFRLQILEELVKQSDVESPDALIWKLFKADVWRADRQPLTREHGNPDNPLVGGCPFHDSQSGTSFTLWPDIKGDGKERSKGLFGWKCHKEGNHGGGIQLLHALKTGDIDAGWPDAATLEEYCIEGAKLLNKSYPEDFQAAVSFRRDVTYDPKDKSTLDWARWIEQQYENPAEQSIEFARLASDHNLRWGTDQILQALQDDHDFKTASGPQNYLERRQNVKGLEFVIPDLLLTPSTILLHGMHGSGKSQTAAALAKHILEGKPFKVRGAEMPVRKGTVLWCNGDQSKEIFENQLESHGIADNPNFHAWPKFRLKWQRRLYARINELRPQLVVIDSLSGCMPGVDNNKQEICKPLYNLEIDNGTEFPSTTFLILHHNNKNNGFRGHTGIADAVTETWGLDKPTEDDLKEDKYQYHLPDGSLGHTEMRRIVTIGKSRIGREGDQLITYLHEDDSMDIEDHTPVERTRKYSQKTPVIDMIHSFIRTQTGRGASTTAAELKTAIGRRATQATLRSALNRLKTRGLIKGVKGPSEGRRGAPETHWYACTEVGIEILDSLCQSQKGNSSSEKFVPREERGVSNSNQYSDNPVTDSDLSVANNVAPPNPSVSEGTKSLGTTGLELCGNENPKLPRYSEPAANDQPLKTDQGIMLHPSDCHAYNPVIPTNLNNVAQSAIHRDHGELTLEDLLKDTDSSQQSKSSLREQIWGDNENNSTSA